MGVRVPFVQFGLDLAQQDDHEVALQARDGVVPSEPVQVSEAREGGFEVPILYRLCDTPALVLGRGTGCFHECDADRMFCTVAVPIGRYVRRAQAEAAEGDGAILVDATTGDGAKGCGVGHGVYLRVTIYPGWLPTVKRLLTNKL